MRSKHCVGLSRASLTISKDRSIVPFYHLADVIFDEVIDLSLGSDLLEHFVILAFNEMLAICYFDHLSFIVSIF